MLLITEQLTNCTMRIAHEMRKKMGDYYHSFYHSQCWHQRISGWKLITKKKNRVHIEISRSASLLLIDGSKKLVTKMSLSNEFPRVLEALVCIVWHSHAHTYKQISELVAQFQYTSLILFICVCFVSIHSTIFNHIEFGCLSANLTPNLYKNHPQHLLNHNPNWKATTVAANTVRLENWPHSRFV